MKKFNKPVVLVAPLDWGLGHATRCIPLIKALSAAGCEVIIATDGPQQMLLQQEFPEVSFLQLAGYQVQYSKTGLLTTLALIAQIPGILSSIRTEHQWLKEIIKKNKIDLVISDNRYGLYNREIPCVLITHQLLIRTSFGNLADKWLQRLHYSRIKRFNACWVPDYIGPDNLAGDLSHPLYLPPVPVEYIGPLSRFHNTPLAATRKHILIILSGPEPQRTLFENIILKQLEKVKEPVVLLRGLPNLPTVPQVANPSVKMYNHVETAKLHELIMQAGFVISRSGYSSVMDLIPLGMPCAFIPTPGQPEQIYLARYLSSKQFCRSYAQKSFSIKQIMQDMETFRPHKLEANVPDYQQVLLKILERVVAAG